MATRYHAGTQVSGEVCHYHHMCPLEAQRETKSGSIFPLKNNFLEVTTTLQKIPPNSTTYRLSETQMNLGRCKCA